MELFNAPHSRPYARLTGILYLSIAVFGAFAIAYVPSEIIVAGDPAATLDNITARSALYRSGIAADVLVMGLEVMVLSLLYFMFKPVSPALSFAAATARFAMVGVMAAMLFFHAGADAIAQGEALSQFTPAQRAEIVDLLLQMHKAGVWIWQVFFTLHLALLGWLVLRSNRFPRLLGLGLMIGSAGYLLDSIFSFAFPEAAALGAIRVGFLVIVSLSEIGFALWLTIAGPRGR